VRRSYDVESVGLLILFFYLYAYLTGKKKNEAIALAWCVL
jgi:hypothetical protein